MRVANPGEWSLAWFPQSVFFNGGHLGQYLQKCCWLTSLDSRCTSCLRQAVAARLKARCGLPSSRTRRGTRAPVAACESGATVSPDGLRYCWHQCCGFMAFWCGSGSGSADPCLWLMDPDPGIFVIDLQDANKKLIIFCLLLFEGTVTSFSKIKSQKAVTNQ